MAKQARIAKQHATFRLSSAALALIDALAQHEQLSRVTILEQAVRAYARQQGIDVQAVIDTADTTAKD